VAGRLGSGDVRDISTEPARRDIGTRRGVREDKEPRGRAGLKSLSQGTTTGGTGVIGASRGRLRKRNNPHLGAARRK
jgi:hypothetical protein